MLKRIAFFVIVFMLFAYSGLSAEVKKTEGEILTAILPENFDLTAKTVSRRDCLSSIMRSIGIDPCSEFCFAIKINYHEPVFDDILGWQKDDGYILIAGLNEFAKGTGNDEFAPERPVTIQECLAFMLRCIRGKDTVVFKTVMSDAIEERLIFGNEQFLKNGNESFLSASGFKLLLTRMVQHKRGWYWALEPQSLTVGKMRWDVGKSQTYIDFLYEVLNKHTCLYCEMGDKEPDPRSESH